jgi:carboxymethylenebutenolidase
MCVEFEAHPPELPRELGLPALAGAAAAEHVVLQARDGTSFAAAMALSANTDAPAVIILPDVRGLFQFYVELAERFNQAGCHVIAIDYFGRTAGTEMRGAEFDWMADLSQVTVENVQDDIAAARRTVAEQTNAAEFCAVGFCFGGAQAFLAATSAELALDRVVGFYGTLNADRLPMPFELPAPLRHAESTRCPVLGLFGGSDDLIPQEDIDRFGASLDIAGAEHELVVYPGAPHSFFDRSFDEHADASADAWRRMLDFVKQR